MKNLIAVLLVLLFTNVAAFSKQAQSDTTQVNGYTKKDGTVVKGYTRTKKAANDTETTQVSGYTKKDGTVVKGYSRKKATKTSK